MAAETALSAMATIKRSLSVLSGLPWGRWTPDTTQVVGGGGDGKKTRLVRTVCAPVWTVNTRYGTSDRTESYFLLLAGVYLPHTPADSVLYIDDFSMPCFAGICWYLEPGLRCTVVGSVRGCRGTYMITYINNKL